MAEPVECLATSQRLDLGEGPLWHPGWQELLVLDVPCGSLHRFDAQLSHLGTITLGRPTSALTWQPDGSILCFHERGEISRLAHPQARAELALSIPEESGGMFNDVIADPHGRILCGALPIGGRPGKLYSIEPDRTYRVLLDDLMEPNGMGFSADGTVLYFADSVGQTIWRFAYDPNSGALSQRAEFHRTHGDELPDGLTVDTEGRIVCAIWGGACLLRLSAGGEIIDRMPVPAARVTSVAFGGGDLRSLFITSALQDGAIDARDQAAGAVFKLAGMGRGRPEWPSRLSV